MFFVTVFAVDTSAMGFSARCCCNRKVSVKLNFVRKDRSANSIEVIYVIRYQLPKRFPFSAS